MWASEIAQVLGGRLLGEDRYLSGLKPLMLAEISDLSFVIWPKDIGMAKKSSAGCIIAEMGVAADIADEISCSLIASENLFDTFSLLKILKTNGLFPEQNSSVLGLMSVDPEAIIDKTAIIGKSHIARGVRIGANVRIGDKVFIGAHTVIEPGVVIYDDVHLGSHCLIGANSVIGSDGFVPYGMAPSTILPSLGTVRILDQSRIGALCTVDRGLMSQTLIGEFCLIDNMVHIGHDVKIGAHVIIAAQSGLAGFVDIESEATLGGQVGVAPHVRIKAGARISGKSMVHCDIGEREIWSGNPSVPHAAYLRAYGQAMNVFKGRHGRKKPAH